MDLRHRLIVFLDSVLEDMNSTINAETQLSNEEILLLRDRLVQQVEESSSTLSNRVGPITMDVNASSSSSGCGPAYNLHAPNVNLPFVVSDPSNIVDDVLNEQIRLAQNNPEIKEELLSHFEVVSQNIMKSLLDEINQTFRNACDESTLHLVGQQDNFIERRNYLLNQFFELNKELEQRQNLANVNTMDTNRNDINSRNVQSEQKNEINESEDEFSERLRCQVFPRGTIVNDNSLELIMQRGRQEYIESIRKNSDIRSTLNYTSKSVELEQENKTEPENETTVFPVRDSMNESSRVSAPEQEIPEKFIKYLRISTDTTTTSTSNVEKIKKDCTSKEPKLAIESQDELTDETTSEEPKSSGFSIEGISFQLHDVEELLDESFYRTFMREQIRQGMESIFGHHGQDQPQLDQPEFSQHKQSTSELDQPEKDQPYEQEFPEFNDRLSQFQQEYLELSQPEQVRFQLNQLADYPESDQPEPDQFQLNQLNYYPESDQPEQYRFELNQLDDYPESDQHGQYRFELNQLDDYPESDQHGQYRFELNQLDDYPEADQPEQDRFQLNQLENYPESDQPEQDRFERNQLVDYPELDQPVQDRSELNQSEDYPELDQPVQDRSELELPVLYLPEQDHPELNQPERDQTEQYYPVKDQPNQN